MEIGVPGVGLDLVLSNVQESGPNKGIELATIQSQKMEEIFVQDQALRRFHVFGKLALNKVHFEVFCRPYFFRFQNGILFCVY
jgi:hypothetical protein